MHLRVMVVDEEAERAALLDGALREAGYSLVARVGPNEDLLARVREIRPDIIIIDMEAPSRDTLEHMRSISRDCPRPIVMFTQDDASATIQDAVRAGVSAYVVDGLKPERVRPILDVAIARFREYQELREELEDTRTKLADRKTIERAKGVLMKKRGCSEEEAYQLLRKLAMDRNQRIGEVAANVVAMADLLG